MKKKYVFTFHEYDLKDKSIKITMTLRTRPITGAEARILFQKEYAKMNATSPNFCYTITSGGGYLSFKDLV